MTSGNGVHVKEEPEKKKIKYPKSVFFIISNEFCERFSYYGMRSVLALYLKGALGYSENGSTVIYHIFVMLCYFSPVFGGIMADAWLGKFKTILYVSILYATGNIVLSIGSIEKFSIPHKELSLLGLLLIALGTGGIKPCVSSFGGDQFVMPDQERQLQRFFSVFYFSINAGSVISSFLTPMLRELHCLGSDDDCYPLAFGLPAVLMVVALIFFICGSGMYKKNKPQGNIVLDVSKCVGHAVARKCGSKEKKEHWLDYADDKYSPTLIADVKVLMKLIKLFSPTIVFWALYEQQGSRWTFQANRMDGDFGFFVMQPDQMQTLNPVLVLLFIPIFESVIYPLLAKMRLIRTPLQRLCTGGILAALAFVVSGFLQLQIQNGSSDLPSSGHSGLQFYNSIPGCSVHFNKFTNDNLAPFDASILNEVSSQTTDMTISSNCSLKAWSGNIELKDGQVSSYLLLKENDNISVFPLNVDGRDEMTQAENYAPKIKLIYSGTQVLKIQLKYSDNTVNFDIPTGKHQSNMTELPAPGTYSVTVNDKKINDLKLKQGGIYMLMIEDDSTLTQESQLFAVLKPNSISMLWQIPQYLIITAAEIMFSITGLEFSYSQSPDSMKSMISSLWLLTDSFGNVIVLIVAGAKLGSEAMEMFLYAGMMGTVMFIFIFLARSYTYYTPNRDEHKLKDNEVDEQTAI